MSFLNYDTYIFDCDGVLIDSNCVKGKAFYKIAKKYDDQVADKFLAYHQEHGGVSRFKKFELLHTTFLENSSIDNIEKDLQDFYDFMKDGLRHCEVCQGAAELLPQLEGKKRFVSSGGFEPEVQNVLKMNNLDHYFKQIFGSPQTKYDHVEVIGKQVDLGKVVFIGDSITDLRVAEHFGFDFVFVTKYSQTPDLMMPKTIKSLVTTSLSELIDP